MIPTSELNTSTFLCFVHNIVIRDELTPSHSYYPYQDDKRVKPGNLLTEL